MPRIINHPCVPTSPNLPVNISGDRNRLATEAIEGASLALEGVDDVERRDGLALGVLGVRDGVTDDTLQEGLEHTTGLLVDH